MQPNYYTEVDLHEMSADQVRRLNVGWFLGIKRFEHLRKGRWDSGIERHWPMEKIHYSATLAGKSDACLHTRRDGDLFLTRLSHQPQRVCEVGQ